MIPSSPCSALTAYETTTSAAAAREHGEREGRPVEDRVEERGDAARERE